MVALLFTLFNLMHLGTLFLCGILAATVLLIYEHWLLRNGDLNKLDAAFFNMNGYISVALLLFTAADVLTR
jgi:4-hydroxybenzoate polyprenyltransferase